MEKAACGGQKHGWWELRAGNETVSLHRDTETTHCRAEADHDPCGYELSPSHYVQYRFICCKCRRTYCVFNAFPHANLNFRPVRRKFSWGITHQISLFSADFCKVILTSVASKQGLSFQVQEFCLLACWLSHSDTLTHSPDCSSNQSWIT